MVIIILILFFLLRYFIIPSFIYHQDKYKVVVFVGKPGSFKTSEAIRIAVKNNIKNRKTYSNYDIPVDNVIKYDTKEIGNDFGTDCDILIDEAADSFDGRHWKKFDQKHSDLLNDHRHNRQNIYYFCQNWDLDKRIRDKADYIVYCQKISPILGLQRIIIKKFGLKPADRTADSDSQMVDELNFKSPLAGGWRIINYEQYFYLNDTHRKLHSPDPVHGEVIHNPSMKKRHQPKHRRYQPFLARLRAVFKKSDKSIKKLQKSR